MLTFVNNPRRVVNKWTLRLSASCTAPAQAIRRS